MVDELLECLHCGYKWKPNKKSNGFPKQCPKCHSKQWAEYPRVKQNVCDCSDVYISDKVYENLFRLKSFPSESFASIVDRIMQFGKPSLVIVYKSKPKPHHVVVSCDSKDKLTHIKNEYEWKSYDEALWRVMNNDTNSKL